MIARTLFAVVVLVAATGFMPGSPCRAGGIISAGSSGTLYFGGNWPGRPNVGSTVVLGRTLPIEAFRPASPPAATPAAIAPVPMPTLAPPPAPAPTYALSFSAASAPVVTLPPVSVPTPATNYDAFINFGTGPYLDQGLLTAGAAQSWATSPSLVTAYGRAPSATELHDFSQGVLARVESTFAQSGLAIRATTDPTAQAAHTLSVASGLSASSSPGAIGISRMGHNGFSFIDKLAYARSPEELQWAVARNVAHELMHAFGGSHHTTAEGGNLDAAVSEWSVLTDPNTRFSAASVDEMRRGLREGGLAQRYGLGAQDLGHQHMGGTCPQCQLLQVNGRPVPEPATIVLWGAAAGVAALIGRRRALARRAA